MFLDEIDDIFLLRNSSVCKQKHLFMIGFVNIHINCKLNRLVNFSSSHICLECTKLSDCISHGLIIVNHPSITHTDKVRAKAYDIKQASCRERLNKEFQGFNSCYDCISHHRPTSVNNEYEHVLLIRHILFLFDFWSLFLNYLKLLLFLLFLHEGRNK